MDDEQRTALRKKLRAAPQPEVMSQRTTKSMPRWASACTSQEAG